MDSRHLQSPSFAPRGDPEVIAISHAFLVFKVVHAVATVPLKPSSYHHASLRSYARGRDESGRDVAAELARGVAGCETLRELAAAADDEGMPELRTEQAPAISCGL